MRTLEQFIQPVKGQKENTFLTCSRRFIISNKLEQLEFKLEKNNWDLETYRISWEKKSDSTHQVQYFWRTNRRAGLNKRGLGTKLVI